jgi:hypothetical protein
MINLAVVSERDRKAFRHGALNTIDVLRHSDHSHVNKAVTALREGDECI